VTQSAGQRKMHHEILSQQELAFRYDKNEQKKAGIDGISRR